MAVDSFARVDREARRLLDKMNITGPAVDVTKVARALELDVLYQGFQADLSGVLVKTGEKNTIGVNSKHTKTRQRFSIAHEIGHFWLNHPGDMFVDKAMAAIFFRDGRSGDGTSLHEMEANRFAAALLMPAHLLVDSFLAGERDGTTDINQVISRLARQYEVSVQAMRIRLSSLGLLSAA